VNFRVAVRVNHDQVSRRITSAVNTTDNVVNVPACVLGDALVADTADALLSKPKPNQLLPTFERVEHLETLTIFEVTFPGRVEGIRLCFYFNVPPDGYLCRITKRCHDWLTIWPILTRLRSKDPIP